MARPPTAGAPSRKRAAVYCTPLIRGDQEDRMTAEASAASRLSREPLGRQIAEILREEILVGILEPDEHLTQMQLCERFGTSRMPVRDALLNLTYDGLVVDEGAGRVRVARFSARDLQDVYRFEGMLHGIACERVAPLITAGQLAELERLHASTKDAVQEERFAEVDASSWRFSRRINQLSESARLMWVMGSVGTAIPRSFVQTLPHCAPRMAEEQADLLQALTARDAEKARLVAEQHTQSLGAEFIAYLRSKGILSD
jgi:DNA-binding GntR family transcriptional regulator